ncbi:MAG TPA: pyruvate kinase [Vicinamibacterales bacterium]|nr:pyruvate kinase [Vicinamibacterales bacterium]
MRQTKIIATVGPASDTDDLLDALIAAGTDIVRLNFSHGTHESHGATFARVRAAAGRARREVAILQDLGGPKIRTGLLEGGRPIRLAAGEALRIETGDALGRPGVISTAFDGLARGVQRGSHLLLSDGTIELEVLDSDGRDIETRVVEGGMLGEHKGINAPGVELPTSAITLKDMDDLQFGLSLGVDLVALSFVQSADDMRRARQIVLENDGDVPLIAKIERPQALEQLDDILRYSDMVMIARGDLGLEMPLERVPLAQKAITRRARAHKIPVILATQVLESMTMEGRPTRAEVSDAANAVEDGVDAIMLSGETASGVHPARVVQTLDRIIREAEGTLSPRPPLSREHPDDNDHAQAICEAAVTLAERGNARAIVAVTRGGSTARRLSALRPRVPIFATTDREETARRLTPFWGVVPVCTEIAENVGAAGLLIGQQLVRRKLVRAGESVVLVSINPDLSRTDANYLKIQTL